MTFNEASAAVWPFTRPSHNRQMNKLISFISCKHQQQMLRHSTGRQAVPLIAVISLAWTLLAWSAEHPLWLSVDVSHRNTPLTLSLQPSCS